MTVIRQPKIDVNLVSGAKLSFEGDEAESVIAQFELSNHTEAKGFYYVKDGYRHFEMFSCTCGYDVTGVVEREGVEPKCDPIPCWDFNGNKPKPPVPPTPPVKKGNVTIQFLDEANNKELKPAKQFSGEIGEVFTITPDSIDKYVFDKDKSDSLTGKYTEKEQIVKLRYKVGE